MTLYEELDQQVIAMATTQPMMNSNIFEILCGLIEERFAKLEAKQNLVAKENLCNCSYTTDFINPLCNIDHKDCPIGYIKKYNSETCPKLKG